MLIAKKSPKALSSFTSCSGRRSREAGDRLRDSGGFVPHERGWAAVQHGPSGGDRREHECTLVIADTHRLKSQTLCTGVRCRFLRHYGDRYNTAWNCVQLSRCTKRVLRFRPSSATPYRRSSHSGDDFRGWVSPCSKVLSLARRPGVPTLSNWPYLYRVAFDSQVRGGCDGLVTLPSSSWDWLPGD